MLKNMLFLIVDVKYSTFTHDDVQCALGHEGVNVDLDIAASVDCSFKFSSAFSTLFDEYVDETGMILKVETWRDQPTTIFPVSA
jgi:hypothetical protein